MGGYLLAWTDFGLVTYGILAATGALVRDHPDAGRWIGAGVFLPAGPQQLSPLKDMGPRHCQSPVAGSSGTPATAPAPATCGSDSTAACTARAAAGD
ncbi:DUF2182 domain-containing protein [Streptomyces sp. NPDC001728]|uniref:copper chaperone n=1 Tax=Streptomyces sp. NPDC001728 TaxID=3154396 RepID=UPI00331CCB6D